MSTLDPREVAGLEPEAKYVLLGFTSTTYRVTPEGQVPINTLDIDTPEQLRVGVGLLGLFGMVPEQVHRAMVRGEEIPPVVIDEGATFINPQNPGIIEVIEPRWKDDKAPPKQGQEELIRTVQQGGGHQLFESVAHVPPQ